MAAPLTTVRVATNQPATKTARLSVNFPRTNADYNPASPTPYTPSRSPQESSAHSTTPSQVP